MWEVFAGFAAWYAVAALVVRQLPPGHWLLEFTEKPRDEDARLSLWVGSPFIVVLFAVAWPVDVVVRNVLTPKKK